MAQARIQDDAESEKESINGKEYMNDFATEEFVTKNHTSELNWKERGEIMGGSDSKETDANIAKLRQF